MRELHPLPAEHFRRFVEYVLCEARGCKGHTLIYWREDLRQPITFLDTGMVPVTHIRTCLRILGITQEKFLAIMDALRPASSSEAAQETSGSGGSQ